MSHVKVELSTGEWSAELPIVDDADSSTVHVALVPPAGYAAAESAYQEAVTARLDALTASCVVLVVALFCCVGAVVVQTLVRSFEDR